MWEKLRLGIREWIIGQNYSVTKLLNNNYIFFPLVSCIILVGILWGNAWGADWVRVFSQVDEHLAMPYDTVGFLNPPWLLLFIPHAWLPTIVGTFINSLLNVAMLIMLVYKLGGKREIILLTLTTPAAWALYVNNNIDWIPMLGLLLPPYLGIIAITAKPHIFGMVVIIWIKQYGLKVILPTLLVVAVSLGLYGFWPSKINADFVLVGGNLSIFPYGLPLGMWLLYRAWQGNDYLLAAVSTYFFTPYIALYSLASLIGVTAIINRKVGWYLWLLLWVMAIIQHRNIYCIFPPGILCQ